MKKTKNKKQKKTDTNIQQHFHGQSIAKSHNTQIKTTKLINPFNTEKTEKLNF